MRSAESTDALLRPTPVLQFRIPHFTFRTRMSHLLALALLGVDCLVRAWRIQLAVWTAGGRLSFDDAFRLNLYGEAASQLTPNRLGGELARSGFVRHRVRRQWRVAWAHVRRAPWWALGAGALLTVVSLAARALILPALAWGLPDRPPFPQMFFGALALLHAPLIVPLPSGGGGLEVAFINGFAGDFGARQVTMLLLWRVYTAILLTVLGVYALVRSVGYHAAVQLFKIGWGKRSGDRI